MLEKATAFRLISYWKRLGEYCHHCSMVLLALADRMLFQAAQASRPSFRVLATRIRSRYRQALIGRQHGLCHGMDGR